MKRFLEILLFAMLALVCAEAAGMSPVQLQREQTPSAGEIRESEGTSRGDARLQDDFGLTCQGCEYVPAGTLSQTARTRTLNGARRGVTAFKNVFVKDRALVNTVNPIGFVRSSSSYASGTLSAGAHFVILRKFRI